MSPNYRRMARHPNGLPPSIAESVSEMKKTEHMAGFKKLYPREAAWLLANTTPFANSLRQRIEGGHLLTDNQLAALQRASEPPSLVNAQPIIDAFKRARDYGIKWPKLRLARFKFQAGGTASRFANAIFVMEGESTLGLIDAGQFRPYNGCTPEQRADILAAIADPAAAAVAYGKRTGRCSVCGKGLEVTESIDMGIGPICRTRFFGEAYKDLS